MDRFKLKAVLAKDGLVGVLRVLGYEVTGLGSAPPKEVQLWEQMSDPRVMARVLLALVGSRTLLLLALMDLLRDLTQFAEVRLADLVPRMRACAGRDVPMAELEALAVDVERIPIEVLPFPADHNHSWLKRVESQAGNLPHVTNPATVPPQNRWQWLASECVTTTFAALCVDRYPEQFAVAYETALAEAWGSIGERYRVLNGLSLEAASREAGKVVCAKLREFVSLELLGALDTELFGNRQVISA